MEGLAPATVRSYLAAIRAWALSLGLPEPNIWTPRVHLATRAIQKSHPLPKRPLPITYPLLSSLIKALSPTRDHLIIASALSIQFFGCLRASELCSNLDQALVPTRSDISFYSRDGAPVMLYRCRSSKTASHGFTLHLGCSGAPVCAVCITHHYISSHPAHPSQPLFQFTSGHLLTYHIYNASIKNLVRAIGLDPASYSSHSIRAGAATQAAESGLDSDSIKRLGRWRSQAYSVYLRPPPDSFADFAPALASSIPHPPS